MLHIGVPIGLTTHSYPPACCDFFILIIREFKKIWTANFYFSISMNSTSWTLESTLYVLFFTPFETLVV